MVATPAGRSLARAVVLLAGCAAGAATTWWLTEPPLSAVTRPVLRDGLGGLRGLAFADALTGLMAALLLGCAAWLLLSTVLAATAVLLRQTAPALVEQVQLVAALTDGLERTCPRAVRRLVATALGVAVTAGVAGPALAAPTGPAGLDGLAVPDRVSGRVVGDAPATAARTVISRAPAAVVVRAGDSLWSISAQLTRPTTGPADRPAASDAALLRACHELYAANRGRIGDDPDLILPGTRLRVPDAIAPHPKETP